MFLWMAVVSCQLAATLESSGRYPVDVVYELTPASETTILSFTVLETKGTSVTDLFADGRPVALDRSNAPLIRGETEILEGATSIEFRYHVGGSTIPLVILPVDPGDARPETFTAAIGLPAGMKLVESFPTRSNESDGRVTFELPIVPAFVSLTITDEPPLLSVPEWLDLLVLSLLGSVVAVVALVMVRR